MNASWRTRLVGAACAAGLTVGLVAATASAGEQEPARADGLVERFATVAIGGTIDLAPNSRKTRLLNLRSVTRLVDEVGKTLGPAKVHRMVARDGAGPGRYSCVRGGRTGKKFTAYRPATSFRQDRVGVLQFQFHPYRYRDIRKVGKKLTTQYEVCGTGGADLANGYRAYQVGGGVAFNDAVRTHKIGQRWRTGSTPGSYTLDLGFEVSGGKRAPVTIGGSITQTPQDHLKGSITGPFPTWLDGFARNGVSAWWEDGCLGGYSRCAFPGDGSPDFQGTVLHGLWEIPSSEVRRFPGIHALAYLKYACKGLGGC